MPSFSKEKFASLSQEAQHKKCYELIKKGQQQEYRTLCAYLELPILDFSSLEQVEERFHYHVAQTSRPLHENDFLIAVATGDKQEAQDWLGVWTYTDSLRSAHNIGSIIRTVEAFRLGPVRLSPSETMGPTHPKIQKTSMGTCHHVDVQTISSLQELPRPWIALETVPDAPTVYEFPFTTPCTLIVGNEERGVSQTLLQQADFVIQIPLRGRKNSLNVASAFAILASQIASKKSIQTSQSLLHSTLLGHRPF